MFKHYEAWEAIKKDNHFYTRKSDNKVYIMTGTEPNKANDVPVTTNELEKLCIKYDNTCRKVDRMEVQYLYELEEFPVVNDVEEV